MTSFARERSGAGAYVDRARELILPLAIVGCVLVILVPLPVAVLDLLLAANLTIAVLVLLTTIYVRTPLEFAVFPSLLLATTLARLVLNVATTRLILTRAPVEGASAAGQVVRSFAEFVAGNANVLVGLILFVIIVVIQFVVITKGATRISEVAARFALDGMPGRQMAIDADLAAGAIDQEQAQHRRQELARQADFFGAMDGASKFVRGDAVAGVAIMVVNIAGGLVIGVMEGMAVGDATAVFTRLTIGDGLVSQVPALLISLAAGLLVTRSSQESDLSADMVRQVLARPQVLAVAGGLLGILVFTSLPTVPLLLVGGSCLGLATVLTRRQREAEAAAEAAAGAAPAPRDLRIEDFLRADPMEIELGVALIRLADGPHGLLDHIARVRQAVAAQLGIVVPKIRIRDNLQLPSNAYAVRIAGAQVAAGSAYPSRILAVASGPAFGELSGIEVRDPASGRPAWWIEADWSREARARGFVLCDAAQAIADHLTSIVHHHCDELLTRDAVRQLIDEVRKTAPAAVDDLIPGMMKLAEVQQALQELLREGVPIRPLARILEALGEAALRSGDFDERIEYVRRRMARAITTRYQAADGRLYCAVLDRRWQEELFEAIGRREANGRRGTNGHRKSNDRRESSDQHEANGRAAASGRPPSDVGRGDAESALAAALVEAIADAVERLVQAGRTGVLLVDSPIRRRVRELTERHLPRLVVLGSDEITVDTAVVPVAEAVYVVR